MKRILSLVLILILSVSVLTACEMPPQIQDFLASIGIGTPSVSYDLDNAKGMLRDLYPNLLPTKEVPVPSTIASYNVTKVLTCSDGTYTVTWSANTDYVRIEDYVSKGEDDIFSAETTATVKVVLGADEVVNYVLTATITAPNGDSAVVDFSLMIPVLNFNTHDEYLAAAKGEEVMVKGTVVAINAKSLGNKYNHVFLADTDVTGGYYCYSITEDPAELGVKVGMTVAVSGPIEPYSGMQEIKGGQLIILDDTIKTVEPLDITDKFVAGADLGAYVGLPVTIKGVELGTQDLATATSQYLWFSIGEEKGYVRTYVTDFAVGSSADEMAALKAAIDADHAAHFGYKADATGILILFNGAPYLIPMSATPFTNYVEVIKTDAEKVAAEIDALDVPSKVTSNTTLTLPSVGKFYADDVSISWTLNGEAVTDSIDLVPTETPVDVTLVATLICGEVTETQTYTITLSMAPISIPEVLESADGTSVIVEGIVTEINIAWSDQYNNITVTIRDGEGNTLYVYRLATNVQVGDAVKITGKVGSYNGAKQIAAGATAEITGHYTEVTIPEAIASDDDTLVIVKGTVKSIDTEWSDKYGNISVTIEDADGNTLYIYRLATNVSVGDSLIITGKVGSYNGAKQIAAGAKAIIEKNTDNDNDDTTGVMTIPEVLAAAEGTEVVVKGTVESFYYAWDDSYGNCSVYIVDAEGNKLLCFRLATKVAVGDQITVTGSVTVYNGVNQIAQGCTAVIDVPATGDDTTGGDDTTVDGTKYDLSSVCTSTITATQDLSTSDGVLTFKLVANEMASNKAGQIRVYQAKSGVIVSTKAISSLTLTANGKDNVATNVTVSVSNDGVTYTDVSTLSISSSAAHTVDLGGSYTYIKISSADKQLQITALTVVFAE